MILAKSRLARQAVPDGRQALRRPRCCQFRQFLLVGESIEGNGGCGGGLFLLYWRCSPL